MKAIMKHIITIGAILFNIILFIAIIAGASWLLSPASSQSAQSTFVVPKGSTFTSVGKLLEEQKFIRSRYAFRFIVWKEKLESSLQAGSFKISPSQSPQEIALALTKGTSDVWVTLLEGWRSEEVADELSKTLGDQFDKAQFLQLAKPREGYLFPDTYLIPQLVTPESMINILQKNFDKKMTQELLDEVARQGTTPEKVVILASLVEREARTPTTMKIVAGILAKRLQTGWPLQVDSTLQYIKGYDAKQKTWWPIPFADDKKLKSAYNTYLNVGLPPKPICNPSLAAITSVVYPEQTEFWYYLSDPQGGMHYATTIQEHNANVEKYLR